MVHLAVETLIQAPINLCFDLARDMRVHAESMANTREQVLRCPESGLLELGDEVEFEAVHFGIRQRLTSKIVEYDRPKLFVDQMVTGAFKSLRHEHRFRIDGEFTVMTDVVELAAPFGLLGRLAEAAFLNRYMHKLLSERGAQLRTLAELKYAESNS